MARIYLRQGNSFIPMHVEEYETESVLQALIAEHPEILAGDDEGDRDWLFVKREAAIPDSEDAAGRFSLDHLFLDREGVPTLIEVKRSSDTRTRREVVAQMLDYAANAAAHWNAESLRAWLDAECERRGISTQEALDKAFGPDEGGSIDEEGFWEDVGRNLAADRIRLVFIADEIPKELQSIVEFLNRKLNDTEVLAIEVKQYVYGDGDGKRQTIVPRLLGQTEEAKGGRTRTSRQWDRESLLADLIDRHGKEVATVADNVIAWANGHEGLRVAYGGGAKNGSALIRLDDEVASLAAFNIWTSGGVEIPFDDMRNGQAPFDESREARDEYRRRINDAVPEAKIPTKGDRARPNFSLVALVDEQVRLAFFSAVEWALEKARAAQAR